LRQIKQSYNLVSDYDTLSIEAEKLLHESAIGVDLEADSLFHYREKVCLLQISTRDYNLLIDPLLIKDLTPLLPLFKNSKILKVFHGADYDIRSLYRDFKIKVKNMFDTQLAARFLSLSETSLANLLKDNFNINLEKKYQKRDWSKRPLSNGMLLYAVQDTCYLLALFDVLERQLRKKGRFSWVKEECELLSMVRPSPPNDNPFFMRFKGAGKLTPRDLSLLEVILTLREKIAEKKDRPPFKIMRNEQIMEIVQNPPTTMDKLKSLSHGQIKLMGKELLKRIGSALQIPEDKLPVFPRNNNRPPRPIVSERIKLLKDWRQKYAEEIGIDMSLVCTNFQIQSLAASCPATSHEIKENKLLKTWQRDLYGDEICEILNAGNW
jgi:ribonuclease D